MAYDEHRATIQKYTALNDSFKQAGYKNGIEGAMSVLDPDQKKVFAEWVANQMFDAARTPSNVRTEYFRQYRIYEAQQEAQQKFDQYQQQKNQYQQSQAEIKEAPSDLGEP